MKKIKIAQIGTGHDHAVPSIETLKLCNDIYELVGFAVVPEDNGQIGRLTYPATKDSYEGVKQMTVEEILNYPGLDAVAVETEDRALTKYAIMAAKKGLHVQMDKPGGIDDEEFDELIRIAEEKNIVLNLGYMYRYNPEILKAKQAIEDGKLGEIYAVEAQMNCIHEPDKRAWLGNYPGGMLYFLGCHLVDLVYSIMGEPEEVIPLSTSIGTDGVTAEDFGMAVFKYKNGVSFVKSTAVELGGFERRQLVICGTKGTIEIKPLEWGVYNSDIAVGAQETYVREAVGDDYRDWMKSGEKHVSEVYGRYDAMFRAFADYIRKDKVNPYTLEYEKNLHKLILRACGKEI